MIGEAIKVVLDNVDEFSFPDNLCPYCGVSDTVDHQDGCELRQAMDLLEEVGSTLTEPVLALLDQVSSLSPDQRALVAQVFLAQGRSYVRDPEIAKLFSTLADLLTE